jgi:hypothetical protein
MRVKLAIGLGLAVVCAAVVVTLSQRAPRLTGSNAAVELSGLAVYVQGNGVRCQYGQRVPAGTGAIRVYGKALRPPDGPLVVTVARGGREGVPPRVVASATLPRPLSTLSTDAPLRPQIRHDIADAQVCLRNRGRQSIEVSGTITPILGGGANPYKAHLPDDARTDYLRGGDESWWSASGAVAGRFGLMQTSFFGRWTMWAVFGVLALLWAAAVLVLIRNVGRE